MVHPFPFPVSFSMQVFTELSLDALSPLSAVSSHFPISPPFGFTRPPERSSVPSRVSDNKVSAQDTEVRPRLLPLFAEEPGSLLFIVLGFFFGFEDRSP